MELIRILFAAVLFGTWSFEVPAQSPAADSTAVTATVRAFHQALAAGDSDGAVRLLAADAVILESGGRETRDEYAAHHLAEDIEFARAVPVERSAPGHGERRCCLGEFHERHTGRVSEPGDRRGRRGADGPLTNLDGMGDSRDPLVVSVTVAL